MKKLRVGIVGVGGAGQWHIRRYRGHPAADVAAIMDVDDESLTQVGEEFGIAPRYSSLEDMLASEKLDVVSIVTPNKYHKEMTIAALKAGCHVLCEKPMAMNATEAKAMLRAAKKAKRRLMINYSYRFTPQALALRREVDRGVLGDIYFARTVWLRRRGLPRFGGWFGQKELSGGGPLIDLGVHRLDLALWLMGYPKPAWVTAATYNHIASAIAKKEGKSFDVEDFAAAFVKFRNGATLELEASWASHIRERELMHTRLLGTKGGLVHHNVDEGYEFEAEVFCERNGKMKNIIPKPPARSPASPMGHFVDAILKNKPNIATAEEGVIVMQLLDAIYESAEKGAPVKIGR